MAGKVAADLSGYELIIMAEVIEHLYTSPSLVPGLLQSLLRPGGLLIVQTPNALAIGRRFKMLLGRHPFELDACVKGSSDAGGMWPPRCTS